MNPRKTRFDVLGQLASLRRYARSLARDDGDAEDLVHDALVRAYEKRGQFRSDGNLRAWLLSILHNTFIDGIRARRAGPGQLDRLSDSLAESRAPDQEQAVRLADIRRTFMALPDEQRAALHLVAIEGLSYQEAAAALGIPVGTLMSRLGRGRAALRAIEDRDGTERSEPARAPKERPARLRLVGGADDLAG